MCRILVKSNALAPTQPLAETRRSAVVRLRLKAVAAFESITMTMILRLKKWEAFLNAAESNSFIPDYELRLEAPIPTQL